MDVLEIAKSLGPVGLAFLFIMLELRESRREARRRDATHTEALDRLNEQVASILERTRDITGPMRALPQPITVRPVRRPAPAMGVDVVDMDKIARRAKSLSDDPDSDK